MTLRSQNIIFDWIFFCRCDPILFPLTLCLSSHFQCSFHFCFCFFFFFVCSLTHLLHHTQFSTIFYVFYLFLFKNMELYINFIRRCRCHTQTHTHKSGWLWKKRASEADFFLYCCHCWCFWWLYATVYEHYI